MDNRLKPYEEYKETGLIWLDSVPKHWGIKKIKHLFKERVEKGYPEEPLLAATQTKGVVPKNMYENRTVTAEKDLHLLKLVKMGDFVISLRSFQGGIEYAYYQGIISPAYTIIRPNTDIEKGYFRHLAKSRTFLELLKLCVTGIREGQNIDYGMLKNSGIPLPPKEEQDQIVRYLDSKLVKTSKFIRNKKKLIELLKEQKQAIINQAVTKGLDPNAKMKPSGIEWLGDIPEEWNKCKLKNIGSFRSGTNLTSLEIEDEGNFPVYGGNGLRGYYDDYTHDGIYLLIGRQGALCGNVHLVKGAFWATEHAVVVTVKEYVDVDWAKHLISAMNLNQYSQSAAQPGLSVERVINISTVLPPLKEQKRIIAYVESKTQTIDKTIERIKKEIDLISEYRTSLISSVVTGKVDVRNIEVEDVPEEIEEDIDDLNEEILEKEKISLGEDD